MIRNRICIIFFLLLSMACSDLTDEQQALIDRINREVHHTDVRRRISIVEDDYKEGENLFKIRGYFAEDKLIKIVAITRSVHGERDDYFYFDNNDNVYFTGHLVNDRDHHTAKEFKYYYENDDLKVALHWEDQYDPTKPFPHEHFEPFELNWDSLLTEENNRIAFFKEKIYSEGFTLQRENPNLVEE